jgi:hypothetical protein
MTSNQRRPGFRLPWSPEDEAAADQTAQPDGDEKSSSAGVTPVPEESELEAPAAAMAVATDDAAVATVPAEAPASPGSMPAAAADAPAAPTAETSASFMRDLVAAMRRVAEEARQAGLSDLRTKSEEHVRALESDSERRREELRAGAESDIAAVAEWARVEQARITNEAEQRVVGRRAQLDQQLAAETSRAEAEAQALRDRVADYERELDAYHAQLSDIADPAAFAAAAKRMPPPPRLSGAPEPATPDPGPEAGPEAEPPPAESSEALSSRLAELDASLDAQPSPAVQAPAGEPQPAKGEAVATEVLVKGLGSFGAITSFRQSLAGTEGIDGVSLSLGPTGEFVFRAIHPAGFDVASAIKALEGDAATVEKRPEGGLRVTLDRAR